MKTPPARIALLALALGTAGVFAGCGAATPDGVDVDINEGKIAISNSDGEFAADFGSAEVPADFPGDVPLPDLRLTVASSATTGGQKAWTLLYEGATAADFDTYVETLRNTGSAESVTSIDEGTVRAETFSIGGREIAINLVPDQGMSVLVTERS